jgi:3-oxoadipate enol-lactonase
MASPTTSGIAYDRAGPTGATPVVLVHAGIADRRMWDPLWPALTAERDAVRLDLRGFGDSTTPPPDVLSPVEDVLDTLDELGVGRCHLVGASYGSGIVVEVALARPDVAASLLLCPPGGSLLAEATEDFRAFVETEGAALERGDLDAAVEANVAAWVVGPGRTEADVDAAVVDVVRRMQRHAFEVSTGWGDVEEREPDPDPLDRLGEIEAPTLVLVGGHDLETTLDAAHRVTDGIAGARRVDWPDVAHLPSLERPDRFAELLREWLRG